MYRIEHIEWCKQRARVYLDKAKRMRPCVNLSKALINPLESKY